MVNRFLVAAKPNPGDELTWYKRTKTHHLKCTWRRLREGLTFLALRLDDKLDPMGTYAVYTLKFTSEPRELVIP